MKEFDLKYPQILVTPPGLASLIQKVIDMRLPSEIYKGIEYIRISSLPNDQKYYLYNSFNRKLIINILKDGSVLNDCLQYHHYKTWYEDIYRIAREGESIETVVKSSPLALMLK